MSASVLVVDDEELICWSLKKELGKQGYTAHAASTAQAALDAFRAEPADVVLLDINLPDRRGVDIMPELRSFNDDVVIIMITSVTALDVAVEAMRRGAWDYVTKPFDYPKLFNTIARGVEQLALKRENRALRNKSPRLPDIVAESPQMHEVLTLARAVMRSDPSTVLLLGESGVGKDVIARAIHEGGPRSDRLFLDINCAALPETLLESELFGHERGAFTGATNKKLGLFELASGGTVFLDEVVEAPLSIQAKLLKVLEQRTFRRVGGTRDVLVDIHVIAATNRDLEQAVTSQRLRQDLYYRLKVFPIVIPPLRERGADILPLARQFIAAFARTFRKTIPGIDTDAEALLQAYPWPGNVRELRNVIERAAILAPGSEPLSTDLLPSEIAHAAMSWPEGALGKLAQSEAEMIAAALAECEGNQSRAAVKLGISRDALRRRMRRYAL